MLLYAFENINDGDGEKLFESESDAIDYAENQFKSLNCQSGSMVVVEIEISQEQLDAYYSGRAEIPCTAWRRDIWSA